MPDIISVGEFLEGTDDALPLTVVAGEKFLNRKIREKAINRPGLALSGFYKYFANKRIQVLGLAELTYLKSLDKKQRQKHLLDFFKQQMPCLVITRGRHLPDDIEALAVENRTPVLSTSLITSEFINLATIRMESLTAPMTKVHGTMVDINGIGLLIMGGAGIGKSEAALGLIERGHSLVADDLTILKKNSRGIGCTSSEITRYHMEIRGLGIIHVPSLFGMAAVRRRKQLDMVVNLYHPASGVDEERTGLEQKTKKLLGTDVPCLNIPVRAGRDLSGVIEVAAMNQRLKTFGHDAAKELNEKLIDMLTDKKPKS